MNKLLGAVIFISCLLNMMPGAYAQDTLVETDTPKFYNGLDISDNDDYSSFSLLDNVLDDNRVFIVGENHQFKKSNLDMRIKIFKYLHHYGGVRTMLLEQGYSWGWMLNEYIHTGDSIILSILNNYSYSIYERLFKDLYAYNESLDSNNKINVIGIDVERFFGLAVRTLSFLLPSSEPPDEISLHVESIRGLAAYNDKYMEDKAEESNYSFSRYSDYSSENVVDEFIANYNQNKEVYMNYLGENYSVFDKTVGSLEAKKRYSGYDDQYMTHAYVYREQYMLKEFLTYFKAHPDEKFYGQFGRCHASLLKQKEACSWYDFNSIATRLHNHDDTLIKGKVCAIAAFYPKGRMGSDIRKEIRHMNSLIDMADEKGLTIFKVDSNNVLFEDLLNKYQYVIINNNELDEWEESVNEYFEPIFDFKDSTSGFSFHVDFAAGIRNINFDGLNKVFKKKGINSLDHTVNFYSFGMSFCMNNSYYYSMEVFYIPTIKRNYQDSLKLSFNGYGYINYFGGDLLRSQIFHVIPRLGIGLAEFKLMEEKEENLDQNTFFGENVISIYKNPGYYFDLSVDSRIKIAFVSLGIKGGYIIDISKKEWRAGKLISESPRTPMSGFYGSANFSVFFGK